MGLQQAVTAFVSRTGLTLQCSSVRTVQARKLQSGFGPKSAFI